MEARRGAGNEVKGFGEEEGGRKMTEGDEHEEA